jgi:hypothetical protein
VGWFGQYEAPGQVQVADDVNGPWTRSVSERFNHGRGDLALYYLQGTRAAPRGLTITISASAATYLPSAAAEFSGTSTTDALDQTALGEDTGTRTDTAMTAPIPAGELVVAMVITGREPFVVTPRDTDTASFALVTRDESESTVLSAGIANADGPQHAPLTLAGPMDWYEALATFRRGP